MSRNEESNWSDLIIESAAHPAPLPEERFREWMPRRRIFISSTMDEEMTSLRESARAFLHRMGTSPIMWEEITLRDEGQQSAYPGGVDRSSIFPHATDSALRRAVANLDENSEFGNELVTKQKRQAGDSP